MKVKIISEGTHENIINMQILRFLSRVFSRTIHLISTHVYNGFFNLPTQYKSFLLIVKYVIKGLLKF